MSVSNGQKKMWGVIGGIAGTLILAFIGYIYAAGGQSREIKYNTERIKRVEYTVEKRFDKIDRHLERIEGKIDK